MKEKGRKGKTGKTPIFSQALKVAVACDYLSGELSLSQVAKKYDLPGGDTARYFVKWYKHGFLNRINKLLMSLLQTIGV